MRARQYASVPTMGARPLHPTMSARLDVPTRPYPPHVPATLHHTRQPSLYTNHIPTMSARLDVPTRPYPPHVPATLHPTRQPSFYPHTHSIRALKTAGLGARGGYGRGAAQDSFSPSLSLSLFRSLSLFLSRSLYLSLSLSLLLPPSRAIPPFLSLSLIFLALSRSLSKARSELRRIKEPPGALQGHSGT